MNLDDASELVSQPIARGPIERPMVKLESEIRIVTADESAPEGVVETRASAMGSNDRARLELRRGRPALSGPDPHVERDHVLTPDGFPSDAHLGFFMSGRTELPGSFEQRRIQHDTTNTKPWSGQLRLKRSATGRSKTRAMNRYSSSIEDRIETAEPIEKRARLRREELTAELITGKPLLLEQDHVASRLA